MSLSRKLFISYVSVIGIGLLVLVGTTAILAPANFSQRIMLQHFEETGGGQGPRAGMGQGQMRGPILAAELEQEFRQSLNTALIVAAVAAVGSATLVSWYVSTRIVKPIKEMVRVSKRIADGHYRERIATRVEDDELGELTNMFNQMAESLETTEERRIQLIADVSHELKTPLASIKGYMEGLQDGIVKPTPDTYALVHGEAVRLEKLVKGLQELSRAEAKQIPLEHQAIDGREIVRQAVTWLQPQFDEKNVRLSMDLPADPIMVLADFDRIRQVLINLLGNALQYTPEGKSVAVSVDRAQDGFAQFSVRDTGVGLTEEDCKLVFQRFYRVDKSRARASGGSGIGLTIAKHIIEEHGGQIWAESEGHNKGSEFYFTLPVMV